MYYRPTFIRKYKIKTKTKWTNRLKLKLGESSLNENWANCLCVNRLMALGESSRCLGEASRGKRWTELVFGRISYTRLVINGLSHNALVHIESAATSETYTFLKMKNANRQNRCGYIFLLLRFKVDTPFLFGPTFLDKYFLFVFPWLFIRVNMINSRSQEFS